MTSGIYKIYSIATGESYYGSSNNCERRFKEHRSQLKREKGNYKLRSVFKKHGIDNFQFSIIEECTPDKFEEREGYYISNNKKKLNVWIHPFSNKGCKLGDNVKAKRFKGRVRPLSDEEKKHISLRMKEYYKNNDGYWKGKKVPDHVLEKMREGNKRYVKENGHPWIGRKHNAETKKKVSEGLKKYFAHNGSHSKGKPMSESAKAKLSASLKKRWKESGHPCVGRVLKPESLKKMSESIKATFLRKKMEREADVRI